MSHHCPWPFPQPGMPQPRAMVVQGEGFPAWHRPGMPGALQAPAPPSRPLGTPPRCCGFRQAWLVFGGCRRAGEIRAFLSLSGSLQGAVVGAHGSSSGATQPLDGGAELEQKPGFCRGSPAVRRVDIGSYHLPCHVSRYLTKQRHQDCFGIIRRLGGNFNNLLQYFKIWVKPRNDELTVGQPTKL